MTAPVNETEKRPSDLVEQIAKIIDPEAFGLPNNTEDGTITDRDEARDRARLVIAALSISPQGGEDETTTTSLRGDSATGDLRLVPVEPTEEMIEAHFAAHAKAKTVFASVPEIWRAMLAAAPSLPGSPVGTAPSNGGSLSQTSGPEAGKHEEGFRAGLEAAAKLVGPAEDLRDDELTEIGLDHRSLAKRIRTLHPVAREGERESGPK